MWILSDKTSDVMYKVEIRYLDTSWLSDLAAQQHTNLFVYTAFHEEPASWLLIMWIFHYWIKINS